MCYFANCTCGRSTSEIRAPPGEASRPQDYILCSKRSHFVAAVASALVALFFHHLGSELANTRTVQSDWARRGYGAVRRTAGLPRPMHLAARDNRGGHRRQRKASSRLPCTSSIACCLLFYGEVQCRRDHKKPEVGLRLTSHVRPEPATAPNIKKIEWHSPTRGWTLSWNP